MRSELQLLEYNRPGPPRALSVRDLPIGVDCRINIRGDARNLGEAVPRGYPAVMHAKGEKPALTIRTGESGRLLLADWVASPENTLTARVFVNRVWHHLFGAGLVRTVDNFGVRGDAPSHPELLDALALQFIEEGWSMKKLIRNMVVSRTYRMSSTPGSRADETDPDNRLLSHSNRRRLEAEAIRDALLAVSGALDRSAGGPSLPLRRAGNLILSPPVGIRDNAVLEGHVANRRTIYQPVKRKGPFDALEILALFDFPDPNAEAGRRSVTTVPTQALHLLNSPFVQNAARRTAERLREECAEPQKRVERLYLLALGRPASPDEVDRALTFVDDLRAAVRADNAMKGRDPELTAWARLCHSLLVSNGFLFKS
jgi:hypothetical protein